MFNFQERQELNKLSLKVLGSESRWRKLQKDPSFGVPTGETRIKDRYHNVRLPVGKEGKQNQVLKVSTAVEMGWLNPDKAAEYTKPVEVPVLREPTAAELVTALNTMLDTRIMGFLLGNNPNAHSDNASFVYAYRYVEDTLRYSFGLEKKLKSLTDEEASDVELARKALERNISEYDADFNAVLGKLPDNIAEDIRKAVMPKEEFKKVGGFDAFLFADDVLECILEPEASELKYNQIMKSAEDFVTKTFKMPRG